jgi:protein-disulfide isomerase
MLLLSFSSAATANECQPLNDGDRNQVISSVVKLLRLTAVSDLIIKQEETIGNTCYRQLTVDSASLRLPFLVFLSPDNRFLSTTLFDMESKEMGTIPSERIAGLLLAHPSPVRGWPDAAVTVTVFSDFQCPYCNRFDTWMHLLPEDLKDHIRLVYKHFPLPMHDWAQQAAVLATCAGFQSPDAFWSLHDLFFTEQKVINKSNIRDRAIELATTAMHLGITELNKCIDHHDADAIIRRDLVLATTLQVTGTPTVFINGVRKSIQSAEDLAIALKDALRPLAGEGEHKPEIVFEETSWNFGTVIMGITLRHMFEFSNKGNSPLKVSIKPG